jgi:hypothetical protein
MNDLELGGLPRYVLGFIDILLIGTRMNSPWVYPTIPAQELLLFSQFTEPRPN